MKTKLATARNERNQGGRPRKFKEPSHPITITLPDRVLNMLDAIGPDRARAIVRAADHLQPKLSSDRPLVEVMEVAKGVGIIVVAPTLRLRKIPKLRLVEVSPARYLLTLLAGLTPADLEIALADILHDESLTDARERTLISELHQRLRQLRLTALVTRAEMLFVSI